MNVSERPRRVQVTKNVTKMPKQIIKVSKKRPIAWILQDLCNDISCKVTTVLDYLGLFLKLIGLSFAALVVMGLQGVAIYGIFYLINYF